MLLLSYETVSCLCIVCHWPSKCETAAAQQSGNTSPSRGSNDGTTSPRKEGTRLIFIPLIPWGVRPGDACFFRVAWLDRPLFGSQVKTFVSNDKGSLASGCVLVFPFPCLLGCHAACTYVCLSHPLSHTRTQ